MKNRMILIIILVSIILIAFMMLHGIKIGKFEILSISQIKEKNDMLDKRIDAASELTSVDFPKNVETLEKNFEDYTIEKEKYEELTGDNGNDVEKIYETKQYDISYLWRVLGKYAESRGLTLGIDVQSSNRMYDFKFNVSGKYTNIIQFITDIENDSDLYFRIYNFKMSGSSTVTATFTVKNININPDTIKNQTNSINLTSDNEQQEGD